jgi:multicomponent Na+:H+ antiporter subunit D
MNLNSWILLSILLSSAVPAAIIFCLREESRRLRTVVNLGGAVLKLALVGIVLWGVYHNHTYELRMPLLPGLDFYLNVDALSMLFATLSTGLWLMTTIYAVGYLEGSPHRSRFFGFFSLCVTATIGVSLSGNLFTFLIFYELLTLSTYPLVVHRGTEKSLQAGRVYLTYTVGGGVVLTLAIAWLQALAGPVDFTTGGALAHIAPEHAGELTWIFGLMIAGLGVKAALVPLHGWLPQAMVAPAPVSALLHAVAVVKAGAFGIVRVVYDVYGVKLASALGGMEALAIAAAFTIIYGSLRALFQDDLKRRLAFSTVSQVSYIALGVAILGPVASIGGVVHLVHQGLMKITLFFSAGSFAETLGIHRVSEMHGVGRRMPWTMAAFTLGALGMIGVPPLAGFITKWYLGTGALAAGQPWVIAVLAASSLLNAAYFLPVIYAGWFKPQEGPWPAEHVPAAGGKAHWMLIGPSLVTALLALVSGLLANAPFTPLEWVRLLVMREYQ